MLLYLRYCIRQWNRFIHKQNINKKLHSLTPTDNAEKIDAYINSLKWALLNSKDIKNIAISGPYGAGKSSIIDTYIKKNKYLHKYLKISLANFQDLNVENTPKELERLIELSLLQQFFYHEKDKKIPDSKFKKIRRNTKIVLFVYVFLILIFSFSFAYVFAGTKIADFISRYTPFFDKVKDFADARNFIKITLSFYIIVFVCCCIYRAIKLVFNITSMKFSIPHAEIEIGKEISKSALNTYLDEILYFFEVSKYEVVFIEDLDRFDQSDIFVKLRELNQLINNSQKIKQDVVFVYAIKDDMFLNKERTKFFDFIIPVIPVINNSNSKDKLQTILKNSSYDISQDLISDISIFIDDMRLLYNILNEFYLYEQVLSKSDLNANNLLAIITYKNLFPNDFVDLMQNKGILFTAINKKSEFIEKKKVKIDNEIQLVQQQIEDANKLSQNSIKELRLLYIGALTDLMINKGYFIQYFANTSRNQLSFTNMVEDQNFELIKSGSLIFYRINNGFQQIPISFSEIEKQIDPHENYISKEKKLLDKLDPTKLYKKLEELKTEKENAQKLKLKDILSSEEIILFNDKKDSKKLECIDTFLRNGYITENYLDYISVFHEGTLRKSDYDFLLKVKRGISNNPEIKLYAKDEIIKQINTFDFEKEAVLNYELIDSLLVNKNAQLKKEYFFKQLSKNNDRNLSFIDAFIDRTEHLEQFIEELCSYCHNIWLNIFGNTKLQKERQNYWLELIIKYANITDIKYIFKKNDSSISEYEDFFFICNDSARLEEIISILNIKFRKINKDTENDELDFIFDNCFFELNPQMLEFMLSRKISLSETYYTSNYNFMMFCGIEPLKKYIYNSINEYLVDVYLKIEKNVNEEMQSYISLLNNPSIQPDIKEQLIQKVNTIINDIKLIDNDNVRDFLFKHKKLTVSWKNVYESYHSHADLFSVAVIDYLNDLKIAKELSIVKISDEEDKDGNCVYKDFLHSIIHLENINEESYALLTKSSPWWYNSFETEKISNNKISILIKNNCVNPTANSFNYLRTNFEGKEIELFEKHPKKLLEIITELQLTTSEVEKLVKSESLEKEIKYTCVKQLSDNEIINSIIISCFLVETYVQSSSFDFSDAIKKALLLNDKISNKERIKFFEFNHSSLDTDGIDEFLSSLGEEYEAITDRHRHAEISKSEENNLLLEILQKIDYISSKSETKNGYKVNHKITK